LVELCDPYVSALKASFEGEVLTKWRYINSLPLPSFHFVPVRSSAVYTDGDKKQRRILQQFKLPGLALSLKS